MRARPAVFGITLLTLLLVFVLVLFPGSASAAGTAETNLVFIHHSVGANWLSAGLCSGLNARGYHVADIYYGWTGGTATVYGDHTDTSDWPTWFTDSVMGLVYPEMDSMTAPDTLTPAPGENTIIMFKSCYPNSNVGSSSADEKAIYNSLLAYFQNHPQKMFVLVTPPPMATISYPTVTRELCNWLTDRDNGWLKDLTTGNVFVFDLYNVLTHPDAHHAWVGGTEMHQVIAGANTLYSGYHNPGDDHPNYTGSAKAAAEFVPLLDVWHQEFQAALGLLPTRYEQTDSRLTYLGLWDTGSNLSASGGSYASSDHPGAAVMAEFGGTDVTLVFRTAPWYGKAQVTLDAGTGGEQVDTVDLYSASVGWRVTTLYSKTGLTDGEHTLLVERTGDKNASSSGTAIGLDAIDVLGTLEQADQPTSYQEDYADFEYAGTWTWASDGSAWEGAYLTCDAGGDSVSVCFDGTNLAWMARTTPWYGQAKVSLDGGPLEIVDLYSAAVKYRQKVYDTGLLPDGDHTLHIYWTGDKNLGSWGTRISVDAFDILGTPKEAGVAPPIVCRYQDNDPRIVYKGDWSSTADPAASGGSFVSTPAQQPDFRSAARFKFHGTELTLFFRTAPWYGWAEVSIEGEGSQMVDLYSESVMCGVPLYVATGLSDTEHTVTLRLTNISTSGQGWGINLDAIGTDGYLVEPDAPVRHEEDDGDLEYVGGWQSVVNTSASGGAYAYTDLNGDSLNITFEGTNLVWYARTAPWYGKAEVKVDGGYAEAETVDLYSSSVMYGREVFDTGFLDYGVHTVSIYCANRFMTPYSGSGINVDAIDVVGTLLDADPAELTYVFSDQDDPRITYLGDWVTTPNSAAWGGDLAYTDAKGAVALVEFTGTKIQLMGRKAPWYGKALVTLDGTEQEVDFYKPYVMQDLIYEATGLSPGSHTMTIECLAESSVGPYAGCGIALDYVYMIGYLTQAPAVTKIDDKDASCVYDPDWSHWDGSGYWAAYQDTYAYTDKDGDKVTFTFDGTFASWVACTSNTKGKAQVSLYDGSVDPGNLVSTETIDLYSPSTLWKQNVYSTGLLEEGVHVLVIECLYEKNPASWWYTINVDRFDVLESTP